MHTMKTQYNSLIYPYIIKKRGLLHETRRGISSLSSPSVVTINLIRPSVRHILEMLPDLCTSATIDTFRELLTSVSPFEPGTV